MFIEIYRMVKDKWHSLRYIFPTDPIAILCDLSARDDNIAYSLSLIINTKKNPLPVRFHYFCNQKIQFNHMEVISRKRVS